MRRTAIVGLTGWSAIVALSWWLADRRILLCHYEESAGCAVRATATRDAVLTNGLTVALVAFAGFALMGGVRNGPVNFTYRSNRYIIGRVGNRAAKAAAGALVRCRPFLAMPGRMALAVRRRQRWVALLVAATILILASERDASPVCVHAGPYLTPVYFDATGAASPARASNGPKLIPVDYDPFAGQQNQPSGSLPCQAAEDPYPGHPVILNSPR